MSIRSKYSNNEIKNLTKEEFMRNASYEDILEVDLQTLEVGALIRESTDKEEQKRAYAVQKDMILDLINSKKHFRLKDSNIFEDEGKSGLRASDRPGFQLMCSKARLHSFDLVVVDAVSRLARNLRELFDVVYDFQELGIGILILKERYWTFNMDHTDILRLAIDGGIAQAESMNTGRRVENHMAKLAQDGQLLGGDMFGYRLKKAVDDMGNPVPRNNMLIQEPVEAYTVKYIFERFSSDNPNEVLTSNSLCKDLIEKNMRTFNGDLNWTPSKIIRVLDNTKYMGYQMPGKSKVVDTVRKKKVLTKKEPVRDKVDSEGNIIEKGNLVKINCEPIVSEELWWKAYNRKMSRSSKSTENTKGRRSGLKVSSDAFGRKAFCSCGYCLSRQYTHVATDSKPAMYRYKCRWQVDHTNSYTVGAVTKTGNIICQNKAVSETKAWLTGKKVFEYLFKNGKTAIEQALELIEKCKQQDYIVADRYSIDNLQDEAERLRKRLKNYQVMLADELISINEYKENKTEVENRLAEIDEVIHKTEMESAKREKKVFDLEKIKDRLNTIIDLKGYKVADEMIDMFVERVIYRGDVDGNEEFLWVINLTGEVSDASAKYRISSYNKEYSDSLKNDNNFNIVARMIVSLDECEKYCKNEAHRTFRRNYWKPITIKIAIL